MHDPKAKKLEVLSRIVQVFTPSAPIDDLALFAGRFDQLLSVLTVYAQRGQHAIIYGERGVGKTSLANIIDQAAGKSAGNPVRVVRVNCTTQDNYQTLWRGVLRKLGHVDLEEHEISPTLVLETLEQEAHAPLIVIDELDRLGDEDGLSLFADTLKALSDQAIRATLVLVGVGDTVADLISDHRSIERALVQIQMPRMSQNELGEAIAKGLERLGMTITPSAKSRITGLSEGLPAVTHLLSQHAAIAAAQDDRSQIGDRDVNAATRMAVKKAQQSILDDYELAVRSPRKDNLFAQVLLSCALAEKGFLGWFSPSSVRGPMRKILGRDFKVGAFVRHLNDFVSAAHGELLQKDGRPRKYVYRFRNPMMQPYIILRGIADGRMTEELLREFRPHETDPRDVPDGM
jgi:Cdc6-like AAA superfamily ATPase